MDGVGAMDEAGVEGGVGTGVGMAERAMGVNEPLVKLGPDVPRTSGTGAVEASAGAGEAAGAAVATEAGCNARLARGDCRRGLGDWWEAWLADWAREGSPRRALEESGEGDAFRLSLGVDLALLGVDPLPSASPVREGNWDWEWDLGWDRGGAGLGGVTLSLGVDCVGMTGSGGSA